MRIGSKLALLALLCAAPAQARPIEFSFTGTVAATPTDTIQLTGPNGRTPYTGDNAPTYPVTAGEQLTVTFAGTSNTLDRILARPDFDPTAGLIRIPLNGPNNGTEDRLTSIKVGSIGANGINQGQSFGGGGLDLLFDPISGLFSLDFGADGAFRFGTIDLPTYTYDPVTDVFARSPFATVLQGEGYTGLDATETALTFSPLPIFDASNGFVAGFLGPLTLNGGYSVPIANSTAVPSPPALALFVGGMALLVMRRRKQVS